MRITRNDARLDVANGDRFTVKAVSAEAVTLEGQGGRRVRLDAREPIFAGLAYASTVHSSQGVTCDRVLINLETKSRTTTKDVYYVGVSRARYEALIYTDDHKALAKAVNRESLKLAALEIKQLADRGYGRDGARTPEHSAPARDAAERRDGRRPPELSAGL